MILVDPQPIATWLSQRVEGCRFVGISSDREVFLEYEPSLAELEEVVALELKKTFPEVSTVISVVKPSLQQMEQMVEELNKLLEPPKKNLLQIK